MSSDVSCPLHENYSFFPSVPTSWAISKLLAKHFECLGINNFPPIYEQSQCQWNKDELSD